MKKQILNIVIKYSLSLIAGKRNYLQTHQYRSTLFHHGVCMLHGCTYGEWARKKNLNTA